MYWRLCERLFDLYEGFFERLWDERLEAAVTRFSASAERRYVRFLRRFMPALRVVPNDDEAYIALLVDARSNWWRRPGLLLLIFLIIPSALSLAFIVFMMRYILRMENEFLASILFMFSGFIGFLLPWIVLWIIGLIRARRTLRRVLAEFGYGICTECGYDLRVHVSGGMNLVCPECGENVVVQPREQDAPPAGGFGHS